MEEVKSNGARIVIDIEKCDGGLSINTGFELSKDADAVIFAVSLYLQDRINDAVDEFDDIQEKLGHTFEALKKQVEEQAEEKRTH